MSKVDQRGRIGGVVSTQGIVERFGSVPGKYLVVGESAIRREGEIEQQLALRVGHRG